MRGHGHITFAALAFSAVVVAPLAADAQQPLAPLPQAPPAPSASASSVPPPPPPPAMPPLAPLSAAPTYDATAAPPTVTQVAVPPPPPPVQPPDVGPPPPIECSGPGTFTHDGFYFRFMSDFGGLAARGNGPGGTFTMSGFASGGALAIGGTPSRGFVVGGVFRGLSVTKPSSSTTQPAAGAALQNVSDLSTGSLAAFVDWFPNERRGWHVGGLLGLGVATVSRTGADDWSGASFAGGAFGGYDFWIGPEWSLGLQASIDFATQADLRDTSQNTTTPYTLGSFGASIGVAILYH